MFDLNGRRVFVAGHRGMVGGALMRVLRDKNCKILTAERSELDLRNQAAVERFIADAQPELVFVAAATVGGILANDSRPAEFLYDNLMIGANVITAAHRADVGRLVYLGSSCIYPRLAAQPIAEDALLTGPLEPTNQWYAIAKIAGLKLCQAYRAQYGRRYVAVMPTNLYGPGDRYDVAASHVVPALLTRLHSATILDAPSVTVWGSGRPLREFLHVDDLASALAVIAERYDDADPINVGSGEETSIADLARLIANTVGFRGRLEFDESKPDGAPRKLLDSSKVRALAWRPQWTLRAGLNHAYHAFLGAML